MKKFFILFVSVVLLTGCVRVRNRVNLMGNRITTSYGSYMIPSTWEKNEGHSTRYKYFFTNKKDRNDNPPNNISVEKGTNRYSKKNHIEFRQAIMRQLSAQVKYYGAQVKGSGGTTKNGYIYYTFIVENRSQTTVQHYIVGDYKYVLVHETVFRGNGKDCHNAAKTIINSFKWNE